MKTEILGVQIDNVTFNPAVDQITAMAVDGGRHYVVTANPEMIVEAQKNEAFKQAINNADVVVPDGAGLLAANDYLTKQRGRRKNFLLRLIDLKISGLKLLLNRKSFHGLSENVSGSDLIMSLANWAHQNKKPLVLIGGGQGEAAGASARLKQDYPDLEIIANAGPTDITHASDAELEEIFRQLSIVSCGFTFVAFGHPKQELFIAKYLDRLPPGVAMGVGGTFAYLAGTRRRAPKFLRKLGLEWLWRVILEPKRINRIITATIRFPWLVLRTTLPQTSS